MGGPASFLKINLGISSPLAITLLYLIIFGTGAQSITADRNTRRSNYSNEYKEVRQQDIIKY